MFSPTLIATLANVQLISIFLPPPICHIVCKYSLNRRRTIHPYTKSIVLDLRQNHRAEDASLWPPDTIHRPRPTTARPSPKIPRLPFLNRTTHQHIIRPALDLAPLGRCGGALYSRSIWIGRDCFRRHKNHLRMHQQHSSRHIATATPRDSASKIHVDKHQHVAVAVASRSRRTVYFSDTKMMVRRDSVSERRG